MPNIWNGTMIGGLDWAKRVARVFSISWAYCLILRVVIELCAVDAVSCGFFYNHTRCKPVTFDIWRRDPLRCYT